MLFDSLSFGEDQPPHKVDFIGTLECGLHRNKFVCVMTVVINTTERIVNMYLSIQSKSERGGGSLEVEQHVQASSICMSVCGCYDMLCS